MPILNYTTKINPARTVAEISQILANKGAKSVSTEYAPTPSGIPAALLFALDIGGKEFHFRLPCNADGVLVTLRRQRVSPSYATIEHARSVAWRIVKDWVEAQLALVESRQADAGEVFLPYMVEMASGQTMYQRFLKSNGLPELKAGN